MLVARLASYAWWWMSSPQFSPAGTEFFFCKYFPNGPHEVWMSSLEKGVWKEPVKAWSAPEPCPIPLPAGKILGQAFHVAANGNAYVTVLNGSLSGARDWGSAKLCVARLVKGVYSMPEELPGAINTGSASEMVSWVASDESFLIFSSSRKGGKGQHDIYISARSTGGAWGAPAAINLLNTYEEDSWLCLSPDGAIAFFTTASRGDRGYAAYWLDAKALDSVLPKRR